MYRFELGAFIGLGVREQARGGAFRRARRGICGRGRKGGAWQLGVVMGCGWAGKAVNVYPCLQALRSSSNQTTALNSADTNDTNRISNA
jgi:hypothetical protein